MFASVEQLMETDELVRLVIDRNKHLNPHPTPAQLEYIFERFSRAHSCPGSQSSPMSLLLHHRSSHPCNESVCSKIDARGFAVKTAANFQLSPMSFAESAS